MVDVVGRLIFECFTDFCFVPALLQLTKTRRHFALFIGVFQLCIAILFNFSHALKIDFFLPNIELHFISDVLTLTYFLLLMIHLMAISSEDINIILRYCAFAFSCLLLLFVFFMLHNCILFVDFVWILQD